MIVGAAVLELRIQGSHSLKQKRGVVQSVIRRVRNRFNLAVSEVGGQDTWQRSVVGMAAAGSDRDRVRQVLHSAVNFVEGLHLAEVRGSDIEILELPLADGEAFPSWEFQE
uniref:Uncharacterized protein conserved in bacteria n=1 Tax=uncultured myxobacterium HF0200_01L06 TaxID=723556 RepID=E7C3G4_9BACT|nr:uncharacterized protein conserved in bacteria [uncultured myxobacterium HF0200_01L06]